MVIYAQLDADYDSDDKIIEAGPLAELLYVRSLAFCKRKLSDGVIKASQLSIVGARIPSVSKHAAALVNVGLWATTDDGWIVVAWSKRNRSSTDIQVQRDLASDAGVRGNHERWHIGPDGNPSPKCRLCRAEYIGLPSGDPIGGVSPKTRQRQDRAKDTDKAKAIAKAKDKATENTSSSHNLSQCDPETTTTTPKDPRFETVLDLLVDRNIERHGAPTRVNPDRYRQTCINNLIQQHGPRITEYLNARPDLPAQTAADALAIEVAR